MSFDISQFGLLVLQIVTRLGAGGRLDTMCHWSIA